MSEDEADFVFKSSRNPNSRPSHPCADHINQLWKIFTENVDPLIKVVHVPSLQPAMQKAVTNLQSIPRSFEALMFAIYGSAIMSLKDYECQRHFQLPRKVLLRRYATSTERALSRANFMGSTNLVVLQALVLHLFTVRDIYEPRVVWTLTGIAVRIAQVMGLERDGSSLGLPMFETEMHRRIWWQLKLHDFRTAELCGLAKFRDLDMGPDSTKYPTDADDNQLFRGMTSLEDNSSRISDSLFVTVRCEFTKFAATRIATLRQEGKTSSQWTLDSVSRQNPDLNDIVKELEENVESKYLRYCDPTKPLHLVTMIMARYALNTVRFLIHHPRRWADPNAAEVLSSARDFVWRVSIQLLEQHNMIQSTPSLAKFAWHGAYFQQWHAFIHVLDVLRSEPRKADAAKAWQLIDEVYAHTPDMWQDMRKPIHVAIGNLCLKAYAAREASVNDSDYSLPVIPPFILQLRQQREIMQKKRQSRLARATQSSDLMDKERIGLRNTAATPNPGDDLQHCNTMVEDVERGTDHEMLGASQPEEIKDQDNPFEFFNVFDSADAGNFDFDLDFDAAYHQSLERDDMQTIDWRQWDAWLSGSNMAQPYPS